MTKRNSLTRVNARRKIALENLKKNLSSYRNPSSNAWSEEQRTKKVEYVEGQINKLTEILRQEGAIS